MLPLALVAMLIVAPAADAAKPGAKLVQFKSGGYSSPENQNASIPLILSQKGTATVALSTIGGTATASPDATCSAGEDYIPLSNSVVSFANQTGKNATIEICDNNRHEPSETVALQLSSPSTGWSLGPKQTATLTIGDDDPAPVIAIDDVSATEGGDLVYTVTRTGGATSLPTSLNFATTGAGTATPGSDFTATNGSLVWAPADFSSRTITVDTASDDLDEADETVRVALTALQGGSFGDGNGNGTITDDDVPTLSVADVESAEGNLIGFEVSLNGPGQQDTTFDYTTASNGTATARGGDDAGCDFVPAPGNDTNDYVSKSGDDATIPAGVSSIVVHVTGCEDTEREDNETFTFDISDVQYATEDDGNAVGTIINNDQVGMSVADPAVADEDDGSITFTVSLTHPYQLPITVDYATSEDGPIGDPVAGSSTECVLVNPNGSVDYVAKSGTLTFAPGETSKTITVTTCPDDEDELNEVLQLDLANASSGATITDGVAYGTLTD